MDPKRTGNFISLLRKEKNMTQKQLSEKLNISDKAISRWETGRGFPDTDSLLSLSQEFSVSINELLCGKRIDSPAMAQLAEQNIADAYIKTNRKKRRIRALVVTLSVLLASLLLLLVLFIRNIYLKIGDEFKIIYKEVMGSPDCVISFNYSHITLYGERYVPLVLDDVECKVEECIIKEAQVVGSTFAGKLFFGESIYAINRCENNEIIYLQSEHDLLKSNYYCKETELEKYLEISRRDSYKHLTAEIFTEDWFMYDLELNENLVQMLTSRDYQLDPNVNCDWSRGDGDESITIYAYQTDGPFCRPEGELMQKQGQYYWFDYDDIPETQNNGNHSGISAYKIPDSYDADLDALFLHMFD